MARPTLGLFADHGDGVGGGHLSRCLALAQAWVAANGAVVVADGSSLPARWRSGLDEIAVSYSPADEVSADVFVVDGYRFPNDLPGRLRARGKVLVIDDHGSRETYDADWVLDQNLGADPGTYRRRAPGCRTLLGLSYLLLRADVLKHRPSVVPDRRARPSRALLAMGFDPGTEASARLDELVASRAWNTLGVTPRFLAGTSDVGQALIDADIAITAAGGTLWELCAHGVPSIAVVVADNQVPVARRAGEAGMAIDAGDLAGLSVETLLDQVGALVRDVNSRQGLAEAAWGAIDGLGSRRVARILRSGLVTVRDAEPADAETLLRWANDAQTRSQSFDTRPIELGDHLRWLDDRINSPGAVLYIASDHEGHALGQVRIDTDEEGVGTLSYSIAHEKRGLGWAAPMVEAALDRFRDGEPARGVQQVHAWVRPENEASIRALRGADFVQPPASVGDERSLLTRAL